MCRLVRSVPHDRRRFLGYVAACVASTILGACSRPDTPPVIPSPVPSIAPPPTTKPPTPEPKVADATKAPAARAPATDVPRAGGGAGSIGLGQGAATLAVQRAFISPLDPAWSYASGPWARLRHPGWPADRMVAVLSDAWVRGEQVIKGGVGRRCAIATSSPFATLLAEGDGRTISVTLNGAPAARIGPLPTDGSRIEVPLFEGRSGLTRIELIFDEIGANDGLYIAADAAGASQSVCENGLVVNRAFNVPAGVSCPTAVPVPSKGQASPRLVVLGNGYAAGTGASSPGTTSCTALVGERLKMEVINQGWAGTDVDVRSGGPGDPANGGLDRVATDVLALAPTAVLLIYGLQAAIAPRASWEYAYHYAMLLRTIRSALPSVPVFCSGFPSCNGDLSAAFLQEWNAAVRSAANTVDNCPFIDAAGWWEPANYYDGGGPVYVTRDKIHPNDAGHRFLADKYAGAIAQYLG